MTLEKHQEVIPEKVIDNYIREIESIRKREEWKNFVNAFKSLNDVSRRIGIPFNPKFNAFHWAVDVRALCHEIGYSYCWMKAYADYYKTEVPEGEIPAHPNFHVSYYAGNCITRIDSCRDKNALMVWAYYCAFDPEKRVLDYEQIIKQLKYPVKFGLVLKGADSFLKYLELLNNGPFKVIKKYRDLKIHRREPGIEIYGVKSHHDLPYMFPLTKPSEKQRWRDSIAKEHSDASMYALIEKQSMIGGVLFEQRRVKDRVWSYQDLQRNLKNCLLKLLVAGNGCFRVLCRRKPFVKTSSKLFRS